MLNSRVTVTFAPMMGSFTVISLAGFMLQATRGPHSHYKSGNLTVPLGAWLKLISPYRHRRQNVQTRRYLAVLFLMENIPFDIRGLCRPPVPEKGILTALLKRGQGRLFLLFLVRHRTVGHFCYHSTRPFPHSYSVGAKMPSPQAAKPQPPPSST